MLIIFLFSQKCGENISLFNFVDLKKIFQSLKYHFSNNVLFSVRNKVVSMGLNDLLPEKPLSGTDSRSSVSISAPRTVFNIHSSEIPLFQLLMCSKMPPVLDFSFKVFILFTISLT